MELARLDSMVGGWFIGNFNPSILHSKLFEVCVKSYRAGETEPKHFQLRATEVTVIVSGLARMGDFQLVPGDVVRIDPGEAVDFEAITDVVLVAAKTPSLPGDKVLS